jgi:hypothetical protein
MSHWGHIVSVTDSPDPSRDKVWQKSGKPDHYYFVSDSGVEYNIDLFCRYYFTFDMSCSAPGN